MDQATLSIRSFVKVENPALYEDFLFNIKKIKRIKLFRLIPFLTIITQANRTRVYLFDKILLLQIKEAIELKGQRI